MRKILPALFVFMAMLLSSCNVPSQTHSSKTLNLGLETEIRSLHPSEGIDFPSVFILRMVFDGLMRTSQNGTIEYNVAKSHTVSKDQKVYTFTLRESYWTNGDPVTARDFAYSWKKVIDPKYHSLGVENFYPIKNARAAALGELSIDDVGITVIDDSTLRIELESSTPYFLEILASASYMPVHHKLDALDASWTEKEGEAFVCNGPFSVLKHKHNNTIILKKNPAYWDPDTGNIEIIEIAIVKNTTTQLQMFEKDKLEWVGRPLARLPLDALAQLKKKKKVEFSPLIGVYWYFINTEAFPFHNKKIRKAFSYALNRELITEHVLQGKEQPAMGVLPPSIGPQATPYFADHNIELARQLFQEGLDELGITKAELPAITLSYPSYDINTRQAEAIQEQWRKAFGVPVVLEGLDWKLHYDKLQKGNYQIGEMGWISWLRDPIYILQTFERKSGGVNMSRWGNPVYTQLIEASHDELNPKKRMELFHEAETLLMEEMPVIPVYFPTISYAKSPRLKDVYISEVGDIDFRWANLDDIR